MFQSPRGLAGFVPAARQPNESMSQPKEAAMRHRFHAVLLFAGLPIVIAAPQPAAADCFSACIGRGGASGYRPVVRPEAGCARMCARRARLGVPPGESIDQFLKRRRHARAPQRG
jgi:hypothetical protein